MDVLLIRPTAAQIKGKNKKSQSGNDRRNQRRIISQSPSPSDDTAPSAADSALRAIAVKTPFEQLQADLDIPDGLPLPDDELIEIEEWEILTGRSLDETDVEEVAGLVGWGLFKWQDLQYDQGKSYHYPPACATRASFFGEAKNKQKLTPQTEKKACWDTPPPSSSPLYAAYKHGLSRYLAARHITIPVLTSTQIRARDNDPARGFVPPQEQPDCIAGGKLMPFQMEGFQWLLYKHFKRESCILADDMGLGKT